MGRLLIVVGLVLVGVGLLISWGVPLGRLPGDFSFKRGNVGFYFPLATSIIVSVLLTLLFALLRR
jgi:Protein of unknown function (DUF2905)